MDKIIEIIKEVSGLKRIEAVNKTPYVRLNKCDILDVMQYVHDNYTVKDTTINPINSFLKPFVEVFQYKTTFNNILKSYEIGMLTRSQSEVIAEIYSKLKYLNNKYKPKGKNI